MEISDKNNQDKKIINNVFMVAASNILTILAGIVTGFLLPMLMGQADYGYYKIFTLYISYVGLFHFGFIDGIYLYYAGKNYENLDKEKFKFFTKFLVIFQTLMFVIITLVAMFFVKSQYGFIFLFTGITLLINNITSYYQFISQITFRFKELALRNTLRSLLTIVSVAILLLLFKFNLINLIGYQIYVYIYTSINLLLLIWYFVTYKDITFGKLRNKVEKKEILHLFKLGFPLLLSNLVGVLILNIDRQFVSIIYDPETYAIYAFAYNMLGLATTAIGAISTVLYPSLKTKTVDELKASYSKLNGFMIVLVSFALLSYFPLVLIVKWLLSQYINSLQYFLIIFPGLVFNTSTTIVMSNYYKSLGKVNHFFGISVMVLILSIIANFIAYFAFKTPLAISVASVIVMVIWYLVADILICKSFHKFNWTNFIYAILISICFYLTTILINNIYISGAIYLISFIVLTLIFERKVVVDTIKNRSII